MGPLRGASVPPVGPQRTLHPPSHCVGVQGLSQWLLCPEVVAQAGAGRMGGNAGARVCALEPQFGGHKSST